jgi:thiamine biosynthesis protein ThiI
VDEVATLPILRPLVGTDKEEIIREARAIGTYEISIEPDEDCCTLFVPKHPSTRTGPAAVLAAETRLDVARLVETGLAAAETEWIGVPGSALAGSPGIV